jgi:hypothetical protein
VEIAGEVHETDAAAQEKYENRNRGCQTPARETQRAEIEHAWKRQREHRARRRERFGQRQPERNQFRREVVEHEWIAQVVARIDRELWRKVVAVRE